MTGVAGILIPSGLTKLGVVSLPEWWDAGKVAADGFGLSLNALIATHVALINFVEVKRWQDIRKPGSQAEPGTFFGLESAFKGTGQVGYPGGPFDPLGKASVPAAQLKELQLKEIKNGAFLCSSRLLVFFFLPVVVSGWRVCSRPRARRHKTHNPDRLIIKKQHQHHHHQQQQQTNQPTNQPKQHQAAWPWSPSSALWRSTPSRARAPGTTSPCT